MYSLAILPVHLFFYFGIVHALAFFVRAEVGLKTLPFILAQPLDRSRIWRTKAVVLGVMVALVFDGWWLSESLNAFLA